MKKILLTESEKKQILSEREMAIINSFKTNFEKIDKIDEGRLGNLARGLAAGAMMGLGTQQAAAQQAPTTNAPQTEVPAQAPKKSMYGTPEQRAAAKEKKMAARKALEDRFIKGAMIKRVYDVVDDNEYAQGLEAEKNDPNEVKDFVYRALEDGTKVRVNLKKYRKMVDKLNRQSDVGLSNMDDGTGDSLLKAPCKGGICTGVNKG